MIQQTECPICEANLTLENDTVIDELLECCDCGTELVVVSLEPMALEEAPQVEEDWGQ